MKRLNISCLAAIILCASLSAQNVGIGTATPVNKLTIDGNASVGTGYIGSAAPANGLLVEGDVGIGTTAPGVFSGSERYLTISASNSYTADRTAALEFQGSSLALGVPVGQIDFNSVFNGPTYYNIARIEAFRSGWVGDGEIAFSTMTGGSLNEAMRIDEDGFVGIGTANPLSTFHLDGTMRYVDGNQSTNYVLRSDAAGVASWVDASTLLANDGDWVVNGANIERQSGDVYIGDLPGTNNDLYISDRIFDWDNSSYWIDPAGAVGNRLNEVILDDGSASDVSLYFDGDATTGFYSPATDQLGWSINSTEQLRVDASGNVGIGTSTPGVFAGSEKYLTVSASNAYVADRTAAIELQGSSIALAVPIAQIDFNSVVNGPTHNNVARLEVFRSGAASQGEIAISTHDGTTLNEALRIDENSNLGVGTAAPSATLDVVGTFQYQNSATAGYVLQSSDNLGNAVWVNPNTLNTGAWNILGNGSTISGTNFLGTTNMQALDFRTNNIIKLRLTMQGQLEFLNSGESVFVGAGAGSNDDLSTNSNVFVGYNAGTTTATGEDNTAIGGRALASNLTGSNNVAIGYEALNFTTGSGSTALGYQALGFNLNGTGNTAVGFGALDLSSGSSNTAVGENALGGSSNSGGSNTAVGASALLVNSTGSQNTAAGVSSLMDNTTGSDNTALGYQALGDNTTGSNNLAIGSNALDANLIGSDNTAVGVDALGLNTASNNVAVGSSALALNMSGTSNVAVGTNSLDANLTGSSNVAVGHNALTLSTAGSNTAVGNGAMQGNTSGAENVAVGSATLIATNTGNFNVAVGNNAMPANTSGQHNVGVGRQALHDNTTGADNIGIGSNALEFNTGGSQNVAVGRDAMNSNTTGTTNTAIGHTADMASGNLSNATALGNGAVAWASDAMRFGNTTVADWGFGANTGAMQALIVGSSSSNGNGAYLTDGGTWTNTSDRNLKTNVTELASADILRKVRDLEITRWSYIGTDEYHIGPMAQDFYEQFDVGLNDRSISTIDPAGVALLSIQQLADENDALKGEVDLLRAEIEWLKESLGMEAQSN